MKLKGRPGRSASDDDLQDRCRLFDLDVLLPEWCVLFIFWSLKWKLNLCSKAAVYYDHPGCCRVSLSPSRTAARGCVAVILAADVVMLLVRQSSGSTSSSLGKDVVFHASVVACSQPEDESPAQIWTAQ